ncbi:MAG: indolepyruvate ferredoxin oxidoreductase [Hirschia sp.]|nr:indolepyruvate ferredoxin oxidoreductase [Hirschia sp.]MBF17699.1 indolepyruvate ferredoxin oxidoreductase [Hirschia sp.]
MKPLNVTLDDKYALEKGKAFMTGIQALVRVPLDQTRLDTAAGLNTAGFISGYRGSPLGGYDQQLRAAQRYLDQYRIHLWEGLNEDLGATAVWGSQQAQAFEGHQYDGVFGIWYGKAPGVDRTGDVFKHANFAGVDPNGGVLAIAGDDHNCKSSTLPSQSEFAFADAEIPVLSPATLQDVLDYGLYGIAMSRFSGAWSGMIALADTMDSGGVFDVDIDRLKIIRPDFEFPADGVGLRVGDIPMHKEERLRHVKLPAAQAFVRANGLDRVLLQAKKTRLGLVVTGQAARDVFEALAAIGLTPQAAADLGVSIFKVAMPWPLEPTAISEFCKGLERVVVIEHKRPLVEPQMRDILYALPDGQRPIIEGKKDREGKPLLSDVASLTTAQIARVLNDRLPDGPHRQFAQQYFERVGAAASAVATMNVTTSRKPHFCSGCPHNTSTNLPEGSRALAGIGCHYMATFSPEKRTDMHSQMGGEGTSWIGQSPFTSEKHVFVNLGDGTYSHSGSLAVRASMSAGVNITYKILYNDAVAMTGGQSTESGQTVPQIARQMEAEGVKKIYIVAEDTTRYANVMDLPPGTKIADRSKLEEVQEQLRETPGVSVLIYDQVCATEKRRRIKRGKMEARRRRAYINTAVCEGCGDCSVKSQCLSVEPVDTEMGRKRMINQSTCNQDLSCVEGFCPSFTTVMGGDPLTPEMPLPQIDVEKLPRPDLPDLEDVYSVVFTGVGGTGVTTTAAVLAMAAHLDGKAAQTLDMTGLAQKGGAVMSHVRFAKHASEIKAGRTPPASADAVIACDLVVAGSGDALVLADKSRTRVVANFDVSPTKDFILDRSARFDATLISARVRARAAAFEAVNAEGMAEAMFGDAIYANSILLGAAWQAGMLPVSEIAIYQALKLNGVKATENMAAFDLGRLAIVEPERAHAHIPRRPTVEPMSLDDLIEHRAAHLTAYQDNVYAEEYRALVSEVRAAEAAFGTDRLTTAVATYGAKLMAYKDEYEVARLYADPAYMADLRKEFGDDVKPTFYLSPPLIAKHDHKGRPLKKKYGPWMLHVFRVLKRLKGLRGTKFDLFGWTNERKQERRLRDEYIARIRGLLAELTANKLDLAVEIAELPDQIRGYGYVKDKSVEEAAQKLEQLMAAWNAPTPPQQVAAE